MGRREWVEESEVGMLLHGFAAFVSAQKSEVALLQDGLDLFG